MNLIYYKADTGNFGDELNVWLWEKIFGDLRQFSDNVDFYGIGSILSEQFFKNKSQKKIIFGSGVRDVDTTFFPTKLSDIYFVRGPISSRLLNDAEYISDAAYAIRQLDMFDGMQGKLYDVSYIPYFMHYSNYNWDFFEKILGIHVINPAAPVEQILLEIKKSKRIMASAMHGAILADALRVPWQRVRFTKMGAESNFTSELKWSDWLLSLKLSNIPTVDFSFTLNDKLTIKPLLYSYMDFFLKVKKQPFILSDDKYLKIIDERIAEKVVDFKKNFKL